MAFWISTNRGPLVRSCPYDVRALNENPSGCYSRAILRAKTRHGTAGLLIADLSESSERIVCQNIRMKHARALRHVALVWVWVRFCRHETLVHDKAGTLFRVGAGVVATAIFTLLVTAF